MVGVNLQLINIGFIDFIFVVVFCTALTVQAIILTFFIIKYTRKRNFSYFILVLLQIDVFMGMLFYTVEYVSDGLLKDISHAIYVASFTIMPLLLMKFSNSIFGGTITRVFENTVIILYPIALLLGVFIGGTGLFVPISAVFILITLILAAWNLIIHPLILLKKSTVEDPVAEAILRNLIYWALTFLIFLLLVVLYNLSKQTGIAVLPIIMKLLTTAALVGFSVICYIGFYTPEWYKKRIENKKVCRGES